MINKIKTFTILTIIFLSVNVQAQNTMFIPDVSGNANDTLVINLNINNADPFVAFQTDIQLPSNITYINNSAALTARANGHSLSASMLPNNLLRVIAFSLVQNTFNGNSGSVLTFEVKLGTVPGDYTLELFDPIISNASSVNIITGFTNGILTLIAPDINSNQDSLDFGETPLTQSTDRTFTLSNNGNSSLNVSRIFTDNQYFEVIGDTAFAIPAGGNRNVTIRFNSVVKGTYNSMLHILSNDPDEPSYQISLTAITFAVNELHMLPDSGRSGYQVSITFTINNMEQFVAFQYDMILPSVLTFIADSVVLFRKTDHVIQANQVSEDTLRIIAFSLTNKPFTGTEGDILTLMFDLDGNGGNYNVGLNNVIIADTNGINVVSAYYSSYVNIISPDISGQTDIDFGEISVLDTLSYDYQLDNTGNDTLLVINFLSSEAYFWNDTPLPQSILPGESKTFNLKFNNLEKGQYTAKYTVRSNDPDEDPYNVNATATSFTPNYMLIQNAEAFVGDTVSLKIDVNNYEQFVAFQLDFDFPDSLTYISSSATLTNRKQDHILSEALLSSNKIRLIAFSLNQLPFLGDSGTVVTMNFVVGNDTGTYPLLLSEAILSDSSSQNIIKGAFDGQIEIGIALILFTYNINENWNMLSLPLNVPDAHYQSLFPNSIEGTLFGYSGGYFSTETVGTCTGYWLKFPTPEIVDVYGLEITECVIDLELGWNMIGGPNCSVPLGSVVDPGGIIIPGTLFGFAGGYFTATSIDATKGYWIKASAPGTITISCGAPLAKGGNNLTIPLETLTDFGKIEISDNTNSSQTLYFNGKLDEEISIESYSMPPVSPKGSFDARLTGGYRLSESENVLVEIQSSSYPLKVKIEGKGKEYIVKQLIGTNEINERIVANGEEITISNSKVNKLSISKGSQIPTEFVLHQNYPNPFNPVTQIKYGISKAERVELAIFNVLGEQVVTLVNQEQEAGYYTVEWNGSNVSSGVYLYTLKAGDNFNVKKMILLK